MAGKRPGQDAPLCFVAMNATLWESPPVFQVLLAIDIRLTIAEPHRKDVLVQLEDDPFAALTAAPPLPEAKKSQITVNRGTVFVYDLETVPDESRFPRPVKVEKPVKPNSGTDLAKLLTGTVPNITAKLPVLSVEELKALLELEEGATGKNRSGVVKAINAQIAEETSSGDFDVKFQQWKDLAFDPASCRIVALGIEAAGVSVTMTAKNLEEEREILRVLWLFIMNYSCRAGYNIIGFDDSVVVFRSMILKVDAPVRLKRTKYSTAQCIDLMLTAFPSGKYGKLKPLCQQLGIVPLAGYEMSGDKVFDLVEAGDWDGIAAYVHSDAVAEFELYQRLADYVLFF